MCQAYAGLWGCFSEQAVEVLVLRGLLATTGGGEHSAGHQPQSQVISGEVEAIEPGGWWEGKNGVIIGAKGL